MEVFGLIGKSLQHSFSKQYFERKFQTLLSRECEYRLLEIEHIAGITDILSSPENILGLNVTIPYKEKVIQYLDGLDQSASRVGAVNVIKHKKNKWIGYNSDVFGFRESLKSWLGGRSIEKALILGTGGASKAVSVGLSDIGIPHDYVSRTPSDGIMSYEQLSLRSYQLIINTTPLGTYPDVAQCPSLDYEALGAHHFLYDLVYNPQESEFLRRGKYQGSHTKNGLEMLELQAEKSWEIWNAND